MAHSCPYCDQLCHCGGDIDDICLDGTTEQDNCMHCPLGEETDDFDDWDDDDDCLEDDELSPEEMEENRLAYEAELKNLPDFKPGALSDNENDNLPF